MISSLLLVALPGALAWQNGHRNIAHRASSHSNIAYDGNIDSAYDFIIAGGGTAGLALAARLTEDSNTTVLVIEAGDTGDDVRNQIDTPGFTYFNSLMGGPVNWGYTTVEQSNLGGRSLPWPRGKVLGGSSAVNGLYMVRPSKLEVDTWASLGNASDTLSWDKLYAGMKKSESFATPASDIASTGNLQFSADSHGTSGPISVGWPGYMHPLVGQWQSALSTNNISYNSDPDSGSSWGAFVATSAINPTNWTRSYSRAGYIDPLPPRPNLSILPNAMVTKVNFNINSTTGNQQATGVSYSTSANGKATTITARREVILAGGAVASPQLLMVSGVGPADVLKAAGVTQVINLPGVGQHLRDHLSAGVVWSTNQDTVETMYNDQVSANGAGNVDKKLLSFVNEATAYVSAKQLFDDINAFTSELEATRQTLNSSGLLPTSDATVLAGYDALYQAEAGSIIPSDVGAVEILLGLMGTFAGARTFQVQAGIQHPLSMGRLTITSPSTFDKPVIDPGYMSHPQDIVVMREGMKLARRVGQAFGSSVIGDEIAPGSSVQTDADWEKWIRGNTYTEYHPAGSCALLPRSQGGVVDRELRVYGTDNLRVIDASVFTVAFSAHLMAPTYGLAEVAADMIRAQYNLPPVDPSASTTSSSVSGTKASDSTATTGTSSSNSGNGAVGLSSSSGVGALVALVAIVAALL